VPADAPPPGLGCFLSRPPAVPPFPMEMSGSPKFPRKPFAVPLMLLRPRTDRPELTLTLRPTRPRVRERPWLSRWAFEAQSHGLTTRCLRFKAPGCPGAMQDSLHTCAATLWWAGAAPAGFALKGFSYVSVHIAFSFRELTWRNPGSVSCTSAPPTPRGSSPGPPRRRSKSSLPANGQFLRPRSHLRLRL
jgi:hypothetical protein